MSEPRWSRRTVVIACLGLLVAGGAVRLVGLTRESFWVDEEYTRQWVLPAFPAAPIFACAEDQHPPLYFVCLWAWARVCGGSDVALRAFSATIGLVTVLAAFLLLRLTLPDLTALVFAALLAVSPWHVYISQDLRQYVLLMLWVVATFALVTRYLVKPSCWSFWALAISAACGLYTHNYFMFLLLPVAAVLGYVFVTARAERARIVLGVVAVAMVYAPWAQVMLEQLHRGGPSYLRSSYPSVSALAYLITDYTREVLPPLLGKVWALVGAVLILAGYAVAWRSWPRRVAGTLVLFGLLSLVPIVALTARQGMWSPKSLVWAPGLGLLALAALVMGLRRGLSVLLPALLIAGLLAQGVMYTQQTKDDWRGAGRWLNEELTAAGTKQEGTRVVVFLPAIGDCLRHYAPDLPATAVADAGGDLVAHSRPQWLARGLLRPTRQAPRVVVAVWEVAPEVVTNTTDALTINGLQMTRDQPFTGLRLLVFARPDTGETP